MTTHGQFGEKLLKRKRICWMQLKLFWLNNKYVSFGNHYNDPRFCVKASDETSRIYPLAGVIRIQLKLSYNIRLEVDKINNYQTQSIFGKVSSENCHLKNICQLLPADAEVKIFQRLISWRRVLCWSGHKQLRNTVTRSRRQDSRTHEPTDKNHTVTWSWEKESKQSVLKKEISVHCAPGSEMINVRTPRRHHW